MTIKIPAPIQQPEPPLDFPGNQHQNFEDTQHQFNAREIDWAFTSSMPFCDPSRGYLVDDTVIIETEVLVPRVVDYSTYDSKETGFVGLKNQGATCYMNSLLQKLYHIPSFREAIYLLPTTKNDMSSQSILVALQRIFYELQYSDKSVATEHLIKSFGWNTYDSYMQHDVQELNRFMCNKLEDSMKGTVAEGTMQKLFEGHHMNYIECLNVDCKSSIKDSFYGIQLDVKGCRDVYASFDNYVKVERLEGDNKYDAEQNGLQDANKRVLFIDFPPVLQLQLKRFEYNSTGQIMNKINDRYEFPMQLHLDRENGKYLSPEADRSVRNLYILHSVLVHSGGVHGGHYYASIRPALSDQWYKFDDERVTIENIERALEEQYGGEEETKDGFNNIFKFTKYSSAYMLVYTRESVKDDKICNIDPARLQFTFNSFPHLSRLETKGTTIVMFAEQDNFFISVDSRETLATTTDTFILDEHLKKYELFGDSAFATFAGHIHIGKGVLEHMVKNTKKDLSIDNLALTASNYCPKFSGACDIYIGGLLPKGEPRFYHLFIQFDKLKVEKKSTLKPVSLPKGRNNVAYGTGSDIAKAYLNSQISIDTTHTRIALLMAALLSTETGGSSNTIHLMKGRKRKEEKKGIMKCFEEHFDLIMKMKTGFLFVLYDIHELNSAEILEWIKKKQTRRAKLKATQMGSPLAKLRDHDLFISCLEVHAETGKMLLQEGVRNTKLLPYLQHLLGNDGFREFSIRKENLGKRKQECEEANLFVAPPSKAFLRALRIESRLNEFHIIPDSDKDKFKLK